MSWKTVAIGDVCELYQPQTITTKDLLVDGKYPVYGANGIIGRYDKYNHEESQLLVTCRGATCGSVNVSQPFSWINGNAMVVKPKIKEIDIRFIEYFFRGAVDLTKAITGAAQPQITRQSLSPIKFSYPSLSTQEKIVAKLDRIFAEIDKATAAAEANAKNSYALYSSAVDSIFGKLTDKNVKLSSCSDIGYGYTSKSSSEFLGPQYLRITDIQDDSVDWLLVPKINEKSSDVGKFILNDGDIVFARTGATTGKSYLIKEPPISVFASYLIRVDANRNYVEPEYLRHYFRSDDYWTAINAGISGAAQGGFNASKLGELSFPLPDLTIQKKIIEKLDVIEAHSTIVKKSQENKVKELKLLRQSILKQAFNGDLVKE